MVKALIFSTLFVGLLFANSSVASAHILIKDQSGLIGAVLHINPDDDPIAGQAANLFLDIQKDDYASQGYGVKAVVMDENGVSDEAHVQVAGSTIAIHYVFPAQGVYELVLTATLNKDTIVFQHTQRISRGLTAGALSKPKYAWAEMLAIGVVCGFGFVLIIVFNNRRAIYKRSTV